MYISGGENVYPAEVENALLNVEGIRDAAVVGIPHPKWGESGRAFVILDEAATLDGDAIRSRLKSNLATYKIPSDVRIVSELPRTTTGKIRKHLLRSADTAE